MKKLGNIIFITLVFYLAFTASSVATYGSTNSDTYSCGETFSVISGASIGGMCSCDASDDSAVFMFTSAQSQQYYCCGFYYNATCNSTEEKKTSEDTAVSEITDFKVTSNTLNTLNPLSSSTSEEDLSTPGGIISKLLKSFIFPIAGIILFMMLLFGGFQMLTGATNSKSMEEGKTRITSAIIGFIILFAAYWIAQLLELIFGIRILS